MKKTRFTEEQIAFALRQSQADVIDEVLEFDLVAKVECDAVLSV